MQFSYKYLQTNAEIYRALENLLKAPLRTLDIEATGLDPHSSKMLLLQIGDGIENYVINMIADNDLAQDRKDSPLWRMAIDIFTDNVIKIGHNLGYEYKMVKAKFDVGLNSVFDTMIAERLLTVGKTFDKNKYSSLADITLKYLNIKMDKSVRKSFYGGYIIKDFAEEQIQYAAGDIDVLAPMYWQQIYKLQEQNLLPVATLEFDVLPVTAMMEFHGIGIDTTQWRENLRKIEEKQIEVKKELEEYLRPFQDEESLWGICTINIDSQAQMLKILRQLPGLEDMPNTDKNYMQKYIGKHPIIKPLLAYRGYTKSLSSYGEELLAKINPITGRLHGNFHQLGTDTGRYSSDNPNLQNIPADSSFRSCFVAPPGYKMIGGDVSGEELRVAAFLSMEPSMLKAFKERKDLHSATAIMLFERDEKEFLSLLKNYKTKKDASQYNKITKEEKEVAEQRDLAKTTNFLLLYQGGPAKLAFKADIPLKKAEDIFENYYKRLPNIKVYVDREAKRALSLGYSTTLSGRKRFYPPLPPTTDENYGKMRSAIARKAANVPVQGSCGDIIKLALINCFKEFNNKYGEKNAYIALTVHDEIQGIVKDKYAEEASTILEKCMREAFYYYVPEEICPVEIECAIGDSWIH